MFTPLTNEQKAQNHSNSNMDVFVISSILQVDPLKRLVVVKNRNGAENVIKLAQADFDLTLPDIDADYDALVNYNSSEPYIVTFIPKPSKYAQETQLDKSDGKTTKLSETMFSKPVTFRAFKEQKRFLNYRGTKPTDMIPGDIAWQGSDGNLMGILKGGVNISKVSDLCQIIQTLANNLTRVVSSNFELFTSWGTIKISNIDDSPKLQILCADSHKNKTRAGKYDFMLELGAAKDGSFLSVKFMTTNKKPVVLTWDKDGKIFFETPASKMERIGVDLVQAVAKDSSEIVGHRKYIEAERAMVVTSGGNASTMLGADNASFPDDSLVTYPHLEKVAHISELLTDIIDKWTPIVVVPPNPVLLGKVKSEQLGIVLDHTFITVGK